MPTHDDLSTLTETVIDIADRHTTLYYLGETPPPGPLPFHEEASYLALHHQVASRGTGYTEYQDAVRQAYKDVAPGFAPTSLSRVKTGYTDNRYWRTYVGTAASDFPDEAWRQLLPIDAWLTERIAYIPDKRFSFRVSPIPRVRLYPFGWSAWISLRLLDPHSISDLAAFLIRLFQEEAFQHGGNRRTLPKLLSDIAQGVRADAFGGKQAHDRISPDIAVVTTVLAKHGGSPALGMLAPDHETALRRIARPYGPPPDGPFKDHVYALRGDGGLEYMVHERHGRFLWVEHLFGRGNRNYEHLRCYHSNSFVSLVHAWHLHGLVDTLSQHKGSAPATALSVTATAQGLLSEPPYHCASLKQYLLDEDATLKAMATKVAALKPKSPQD